MKRWKTFQHIWVLEQKTRKKKNEAVAVENVLRSVEYFYFYRERWYLPATLNERLQTGWFETRGEKSPSSFWLSNRGKAFTHVFVSRCAKNGNYTRPAVGWPKIKSNRDTRRSS